MRKRGNGEGSIRHRPDGRWEARWHAVEEGRLVRRSAFGHSRAEVTKLLRDAIAAREGGLPTARSQDTVGDFFPIWMDSAAASLKPTTERRYREVLAGHILPAIGRRRLIDLAPHEVSTMYASLLRAGRAPKTVQLTHTVLHRGLEQAMRWGKVPRNVSSLVDVPRAPRVEAATLLPDQLGQLREAARGDRLEALYILAMLTGMRRGELFALRWDSVDLDAGMLAVRGTLQRVVGGSVVAEPKSATSRRPIALGDGAVNALQAHAARQAADRLLAGSLWRGGPPRSGYVFTTEVGLPLSPTTMTRAWSLLLQRAGVVAVSFHTLRHAATTLTVAANVAPKVAARRLGHSSATITLDRYSHVSDDLDRAAASAIETVLASAMAARAVAATNPGRGHGRGQSDPGEGGFEYESGDGVPRKGLEPSRACAH